MDRGRWHGEDFLTTATLGLRVFNSGAALDHILFTARRKGRLSMREWDEYHTRCESMINHNEVMRQMELKPRANQDNMEE